MFPGQNLYPGHTPHSTPARPSEYHTAEQVNIRQQQELSQMKLAYEQELAQHKEKTERDMKLMHEKQMSDRLQAMERDVRRERERERERMTREAKEKEAEAEMIKIEMERELERQKALLHEYYGPAPPSSASDLMRMNTNPNPSQQVKSHPSLFDYITPTKKNVKFPPTLAKIPDGGTTLDGNTFFSPAAATVVTNQSNGVFSAGTTTFFGDTIQVPLFLRTKICPSSQEVRDHIVDHM